MSKNALIYIIAKDRDDVNQILKKYNNHLKDDVLVDENELIKDRVKRWSTALRTLHAYADDQDPQVRKLLCALQNCLRTTDNQVILETALQRFDKSAYARLPETHQLLMHTNLNGKFEKAVMQEDYGSLKDVDLTRLVQPYAIVDHNAWLTDDLYTLSVKPQFKSPYYPYWHDTVFYQHLVDHQTMSPNDHLYSAIIMF